MGTMVDNARSTDRIGSIDALRGLTVLVWLLSVTTGPILSQVPRSPVAETLLAQFSPSFWDGITFLDLVLPTFLFLVGASIVPAFEKRKAAGQTKRQVVMRILRRAAVLLVIGIICEGGLWQHWPDVRFVGAFQRIAICYVFAACLELTARSRVQAGMVAFLLLGYWALLTYGHSGEASSYSLEGNAAALADELLLPGRKYFGTWDPQGILTTIPAVAITAAGVLAGKALTTDNGRPIGGSLWMLGAGIVAVNASCLGELWVPINAYLWTPTFCLVAIGAALALLWLFHVVLDLQGLTPWAVPLAALGRNSFVVVVATATLMSGADLLATLGAARLQRLWYEHSPAWALIVLLVIVTVACGLNRFKIYVRV